MSDPDYPFLGALVKRADHADRLAKCQKSPVVTDQPSNSTLASAVFTALRQARGRWHGFGQHPLRLVRR